MPSVSKKQHNFMAAIAKNPAFAKKVGLKQSVGEHFLDADKGKKFRSGGMAKSDMKEDMKMDKSQDKAMIKKAFRMHDAQEHKGGKGTNLAKLRKGGMAMKKAKRYDDGGEVEFETKQGKNSMVDDDTRAKALDYANTDVDAEPRLDDIPIPGEKAKAKAKAAAPKGAKAFTRAETKGGAALMTRKDRSDMPKPKAASKAKSSSSSTDYSVGMAMKAGGKVRGCGIASKGLTKGKTV